MERYEEYYYYYSQPKQMRSPQHLKYEILSILCHIGKGKNNIYSYAVWNMDAITG